MVVIKVENLFKCFSKKEGYVLKNVNLMIDEGEIFALLGPNGSGKTTLIHIILTITIPEKGKVEILGEDPFKEKEILRFVNYVPVEKPSSDLKVKDFLNCYAKLYGVKSQRVEKLLKDFNLLELKESSCWKLSTGELSKLSLAKALLNDPKILILDEPTFGLDPKAKREIHSYLLKLNKKGVTIFFATHDMLEVEILAKKIAFIKNGKILEVKDKSEILKKYKSLEKYWLRLGR